MSAHVQQKVLQRNINCLCKYKRSSCNVTSRVYGSRREDLITSFNVASTVCACTTRSCNVTSTVYCTRDLLQRSVQNLCKHERGSHNVTYILPSIHPSIQPYSYIYIYTHTYISIYKYIYTYIHTYVRTYVRASIHPSIQPYSYI